MDLPVEIPEELADALGRPVCENELRLWAGLRPGERPDAVRRAVALTRWHADRGGWTADDAAAAAGVSRNRFYALAAGWEDEAGRSLANLGVGADAPRTRRSVFDEALLERLREAAARIVSRDGADARSVSSMVPELAREIPTGAAGGDAGRKVPKTAALRAMLVEARRLHELHGGLGVDFGFDLCACQLSDQQGRPYVLFVCLDVGTGFVLAYGFGDPARSLERHRALASEVLERWGPDSGQVLPWSRAPERVEMVVGLDRVPFRDWADAIREDVRARSGANLQPAIAPRRFGRYLRKHFGSAVGRVRLLPSATRSPDEATDMSVLTNERYTLEDALARVGLEISDHNRDVLGRLRSPSVMPASIAAVFDCIGDGLS